MSYSSSVIQAESSGDPNSRNDLSSASGPAGFTNGTWLETVRANRPDLAGKSDDELLALKTNPQLAGEMANAYGNANGAYLAKNGLPVTDGTKYLAHFSGPQGAVKILQADPTANAGEVLGPAALKANPWLANTTAQGLQAMMAKKAGVTSPTAAPTPTAAPQPAAPAIPPPQAPIFARPGGGAAPAPAYADPVPQAAPMLAAQRPHIDLTGLQAALMRQRAPIFARPGGANG